MTKTMNKPTDVFVPREGMEATIRCRRVAEQHFVAELSNQPDEILKSMKSYDPLFTYILRDTASGSNDIFRCRTVAEQREFYRSGREYMDMTETPMFTSIGGSWYGFVHGMTTTQMKGSGDVGHTEILGLLPITPDEDTIAGEIGMSMPVFGKQGEEPGTPPLGRIETLALFQRWQASIERGAAHELASLYSNDANVAIYDPLQGDVVVVHGQEAIEDVYGATFDALDLEQVQLILRLIDRWYVFAELLWTVRDSGGEQLTFRTADVIVPTPKNAFISQLGIGTKLIPTGADATIRSA